MMALSRKEPVVSCEWCEKPVDRPDLSLMHPECFAEYGECLKNGEFPVLKSPQAGYPIPLRESSTVALDPKTIVQFVYTNHRGETEVRHIVPIRIRFAASEWHPQEQWLMDAFDLDRDAERSFALSDAREWEAYQVETLG